MATRKASCNPPAMKFSEIFSAIWIQQAAWMARIEPIDARKQDPTSNILWPCFCSTALIRSLAVPLTDTVEELT